MIIISNAFYNTDLCLNYLYYENTLCEIPLVADMVYNSNCQENAKTLSTQSGHIQVRMKEK